MSDTQPTQEPWPGYGATREHAVITLARRIHRTENPVPRPLPWHRLTDAQKVRWILAADARLTH